MPLNRMGVVPGTIGDMIIESQKQVRPRQPMRPMGVRRPMDEEVVRTVVDYRPTPMPKRGRGGREM